MIAANDTHHIANGGKMISIDPELQPYLIRDSIACLAELLTGQMRGAEVRAEPLGAILTLIKQAGD